MRPPRGAGRGAWVRCKTLTTRIVFMLIAICDMSMAWVKKCFALRDRVFSAGTPEEALGVASGAGRAAVASALKEAKETLQVGRGMGIYTPSEADEIEMLINNAYKALTVGGEWKPHVKVQGAGHAAETSAERPGRGYTSGAAWGGAYSGNAQSYGGRQADPYYWRGGYSGSPYGAREDYNVRGEGEEGGRRVVKPPTREEVMEMWRRRRGGQAGRRGDEESWRRGGKEGWLVRHEGVWMVISLILGWPILLVFFNEWVSWGMAAFGLVAGLTGLLEGLKFYGVTAIPQSPAAVAAVSNRVVPWLLSSPVINLIDKVLTNPIGNMFTLLCTFALPAATKLHMQHVAERRGLMSGAKHILLVHVVPSLAGVLSFFLFDFAVFPYIFVTLPPVESTIFSLLDTLLLLNALVISYLVVAKHFP
jgi:hypothetical protein